VTFGRENSANALPEPRATTYLAVTLDVVEGGSGNDYIEGRRGDDVVDGGIGEDRLIGGEGSDQLSGGDDADRLAGGDGVDTLDGGTADDSLDGGPQADQLRGGAGFDSYTIRAGEGRDTITDNDGRIDPSTRNRRWRSPRRHRGSPAANRWSVLIGAAAEVVATRNSPLTLTTPDGTQVVDDERRARSASRCLDTPTRRRRMTSATATPTAGTLTGTSANDLIDAGADTDSASAGIGRPAKGGAGRHRLTAGRDDILAA
jgi:Ca2+-binding RTX toxin-like protein